MKTFTRVLLALAVGASSIVVGAGVASAHGDGSTIHSSDADAALLAKARAANAKYHDVNVAIADGFMPTDECSALPGVGGMGYHYVNVANMMDGVQDPTKPEVLLYMPVKGGVRLAGIEFMHVDADQNLATDDDRPSLFNVPFDGPMLGHEPGMPIHYDLHVWIWQNNPAGLFAPWNPRVTCPSL